MTLQMRRRVGSFWTPEPRERDGWPEPLRALDTTLTNATNDIIAETNPDACRTADLEYNRRCRTPARIEAVRRLASVASIGDWPYPWGALDPADAATSRPARVALARELVRQAELADLDYEPAIYLEGGAFASKFIAADVPGGGVISIRLEADGSFVQPPELTARAKAWSVCEEMEREANGYRSGRYGFPGQPPIPTLADVEACKQAVREMPFPPSEGMPAIEYDEPADPVELELGLDEEIEADLDEEIDTRDTSEIELARDVREDLEYYETDRDGRPTAAPRKTRKRLWFGIGAAVVTAITIAAVASQGGK